MSGVHQESQTKPWSRNVPDHAARKDSPGYLRSRKLMLKLAALEKMLTLEGKPVKERQDHHGGGVHLLAHDANSADEQSWFMVLLPYGIEYSAQFCADPARVDVLRQTARTLVAAFPMTIPAYEKLGYPDGRRLLETEIVDAETMSDWVDGIFNASVPLEPALHTGTIKPELQVGGIHNYPKPVVDIQVFKREDFHAWHLDPVSGTPVVVTPVAHRGSGDGRVQVAYADPSTGLGRRALRAHMSGEHLVLGSAHRLAKAAFRDQ